jgi:hypothetical protein
MFRGVASLMLVGVLCAWATAEAKTPKPTAQFLQQRMARLKQTARTLDRANLPGYAVKYRRTSSKVRPEDRRGAMVVTAVDSSNVGTWNDKVGKHSIGFQTSAGCNTQGGSSGYVRLGSEWMSYNWVRCGGGSGSSSYNKCDITSKTGALTEATYFVTPKEMKAFKAFYYARGMSLIKDSKGRVVNPSWVNPGKSNLKTEGCAGAASSGLNKTWVNLFARNIKAIKAYGQQHNIAALADVPADAPKVIKAFIDRVGAKQQTDPRVLVRHHAPTADLLTVFNQGLGQNPAQTLQWNRKVRWYTSYRSGRRYRDRNYPNWNGLGYNNTIFDLGPSEKAKPTWSAQRMSLSAFAGSSL